MDERKKKRAERRMLLMMAAAICVLTMTGAWTQDRTQESAEGRACARPAANILTVGASEGIANEYPGIVRFHVIANSDSQKDQNIKYMVRNSVFSKLENSLTNELLQAEADGAADADRGEISRSYVREHLPEIEGWAQDCLRARGCDYQAKAEFGVCAIPAKTYDDIYFPAGNYEALTITLGSGNGQNWWCVVFPPLCLVDCRDSAYRESFHVDTQGRLVLKSKILEALRENRDRAE